MYSERLWMRNSFYAGECAPKGFESRVHLCIPFAPEKLRKGLCFWDGWHGKSDVFLFLHLTFSSFRCQHFWSPAWMQESLGAVTLELWRIHGAGQQPWETEIQVGCLRHNPLTQRSGVDAPRGLLLDHTADKSELGISWATQNLGVHAPSITWSEWFLLGCVSAWFLGKSEFKLLTQEQKRRFVVTVSLMVTVDPSQGWGLNCNSSLVSTLSKHRMCHKHGSYHIQNINSQKIRPFFLRDNEALKADDRVERRPVSFMGKQDKSELLCLFL